VRRGSKIDLLISPSLLGEGYGERFNSWKSHPLRMEGYGERFNSWKSHPLRLEGIWERSHGRAPVSWKIWER